MGSDGHERDQVRGLAFCVFLKQRMPRWAHRLIRETLYPGLRDSDVVEAYPSVRGMAADLFFLDHNHPEDGSDDEESKSKSNAFEVST
jgi:hypothetical protein